MRWQKARLFFLGIRQLFFLLILAAVAFIAYLYFYGLPGEWKRMALGELAHRGIHLEMESLRFDPLRGVVARGVRFSVPDQPGVFVQIGELALNVDFIDMLRKRFSTETFEVDGADVEIQTAGRQPPICIRRTEGRIRFASGRTVYLDSVVGDAMGLRVEINGKLDLGGTGGQPGPLTATSSKVVDVAKVRAWLDRFLSLKTSASAPILLRIHVEGKVADPKTLRIRAELQGEAVAYEEWHANRVEGEIVLENGILTVPRLLVRAGGGQASLSGTGDLGSGQIQFELVSNLDPSGVFSKDAPHVPLVLKEMEFGVRPEIRVKGCMDLKAGDAWQSLDGEASFWLREVVWRQHYVREAKSSIRIANGRVIFPDLLIRQDAGALNGSVDYELADVALHFDVRSTLDMSEIMMLLYPSEKNWFSTVRYKKASLLRLAGSWRIRDPQGLKAKGNLSWQDWFSNEVPILSTTARLEIDGRCFHFRDLTIRREEGEVKGQLTLDFNAENALLDATSSIDFAALTRIIGPKTEELFSPYHFLTPPRLQLRGRVHFGNNADNDFHARVECERFKVWRLAAEKVSGDVHSYRNSLEIARYRSDFYGGRLTGDAVFDFTRPQSDWAFHCDVERVDFDKLTHDLWQYKDVEGLMTGWADVHGEMETSRPLKGRGYVMVRDGVLWKIPMFGDLSKFIPVFGEYKATKAYANFTISDQKVHIPDMKISAGLMSLTAKGDYGFNDSVDFVVHAHFFRGVLLGWVFDPLTKPFEYHLGGKLNDRKWKPRFIPKEMLFQFDDDEEPKKPSRDAAATKS